MTAPLPVFPDSTWDERIKAWRDVDGTIQQGQWMLGAIAVSLERSAGGSPRHQAARQATLIQRFCRELGIGRQTFHRLSSTYKAFAKTCNTGGTGYIPELSFKHHEVAARLATDRYAALAEACEKSWSANELQRQLEERKGKPPFSLPDAAAKLKEAIDRQIAEWPEDARGRAPEILQEYVDNMSARVMPTLPANVLHALRWIKADLENIPFTKRAFVDAGPGRGGNLEIIPGAAGAPIFRAIVNGGGRGRVLKAIDNLLAGKITNIGARVLSVARDLVDGDPDLRRTMVLPPEAGDETAGMLWHRTSDADDDDLPACLREIVTPDYSDPIGERDMEAAS